MTQTRARSSYPMGLPSIVALSAFALIILTSAGCASSADSQAGAIADGADYGPTPTLPAPDLTHEVQRYNTQTAWPKDATPQAPAGFVVTRFADGLESPRWLYVMGNGDVLVSQARSKPKPTEEEKDVAKQAGQRQSGTITGASPDQITLLRDTNGDGVADEQYVLLDDLNQPFGMAFVAPYLYVANTDGVWRYRYTPGQTRITDAGQKIMALPAGGYNNHWTRNIITNADNTRLLVSVGSASNAGEFGLDTEKRRATILSVNLDGTDERVVASGLRNPNGMDFEPVTGALWTAVNERDNLGDDLVPDYITSVQPGGFYGWPFSYWGQNVDPRLKGQGQEWVARALVPDYAMGNHTASLGLAFYKTDAFPAAYQGGVFVGQRGSWNHSSFTGYKVTFVPFQNGKPSGPPQDFLTGFMANPKTGETYGRPVGVVVDRAGALLVADDTGNAIWHVRAQ